MNCTSRRSFVVKLLAAGTAATTLPSFAQSTPKRVDEVDEQAVALGYRHDTTKVDSAKYPKHDKAQRCANCSFWQGQAADEWAGCAMFGRKQIANAGWCQVWAKAPA